VGCWHGYLLICLERGANLHMTQLMPLPLSLASLKSRLVLPFWYRLTRVVPEKGPLNARVRARARACVRACARACVRACVCACVRVCVCVCVTRMLLFVKFSQKRKSKLSKQDLHKTTLKCTNACMLQTESTFLLMKKVMQITREA